MLIILSLFSSLSPSSHCPLCSPHLLIIPCIFLILSSSPSPSSSHRALHCSHPLIVPFTLLILSLSSSFLSSSHCPPRSPHLLIVLFTLIFSSSPSFSSSSHSKSIQIKSTNIETSFCVGGFRFSNLLC
ncbi:hypothetical protein NL108_009670 [Boleophthalmus pectinirostris]|nr:hypothetical protein NL108_009670 [Boleophthalmus pectinirostris]